MAEMEISAAAPRRRSPMAASNICLAFARDMLTAGDNLARALEAVPVEALCQRGREDASRGRRDDRARAAELAPRSSVVKKMAPLGQKFDPNLHQAIFEIPTDAEPAGTVMQVMPVGRRLCDRRARAAPGIWSASPRAAGAAERMTSGAAWARLSPP